jgi:hypothetical protein
MMNKFPKITYPPKNKIRPNNNQEKDAFVLAIDEDVGSGFLLLPLK